MSWTSASSVFYNLPLAGSHTKSSALESVSSIAASRLQEGLSAASAQFSSLRASIVPTPTETGNPIILDAQRRYYEAIGLAHDRYSAFVSSASEAIFEEPTPMPTPIPTPPPLDPEALLENAISEYQHVSALASSSLAAVVYSASSVAGHNGEAARSYIDEALSRYNDAMSAASVSLSAASESASSLVYGTPTGTPTGTLDSITVQASERWESIISQANDQIYGTPTGRVEGAVNSAQEAYDSVTSAVKENVAAAESMMSSAYAEVSSRASAALLPEQQGAFESTTSKVALAVESAQARLADLASNVGEGAAKIQTDAESRIETAQSVISSGTSKIKDEL